MDTPLTLQQLRAWLRRLPFNSLLGVKITRVHRDGVTLELPMRDELQNAAGAMHGGAIATLADAAVGLAVSRHFGGSRRITTVELKVNYFRPIKDKLVARARLVRMGRTICVGTVDLTDGS